MIKLGALGDLVLADGALRDIRDHHPQSRISLLTRHNFASLMQRCPWVDAVIADQNLPRWRPDGISAIRRHLTHESYSCIIDLQNSSRTRFYRRWLASSRTAWVQESSKIDKHVAVTSRHEALLKAAGIASNYVHFPSPFWLADDVDHLLAEAGIKRPFVVLLPGSSARNRHKRWPHYEELSKLLSLHGLAVVTIPGIDETGMDFGCFAGTLLKVGDRPINTGELAGVLKAASVVIGNDSGPTHLAACLSTPCVILFEAGSRALVTTDAAARGATCMAGKSISAISSHRVAREVLRHYERPERPYGHL